jgi:hypothetical protein
MNLKTEREKRNPRGAGRPPIGDVPGIEKKMRLVPDDWKDLKVISGGSYAAGVRILLKNYRDLLEANEEKR